MSSSKQQQPLTKITAAMDEGKGGSTFAFTLHPLNVCFANALRRTLLTNISICVIRTELEAVNQCRIETNTTRFHNEIIKHRLSCIPIHVEDPETLVDKYVLEVDAKNETEDVTYVTTEQFRIRNKANDHYLTSEETAKIFPPSIVSNQYVDFVRLRPKISDAIPGEAIKLTADFSVGSANINSMFNVVSLCTYANTMDPVAAAQAWETTLAAKLASGTMSKDEIDFEKQNFKLLDAQRYFVPDSFDFKIESVGIYENRELMRKACAVLQNKFLDMVQALEGDTVPIVPSETTVKHSYDVWLENEDYTMGKVLEYLLYEQFYLGDKSLSFCGFKKFHPHDTKSTIRLAFVDPTDRNQIRHYLTVVATAAADVFARLYKLF
jgi:DNA-directed RNA polymerase subunit L